MPTEEIRPEIPQHPKPKSKGKKPEPSKFDPGPEIKALDVFLTTFDANAGSESSSDPLTTFLQYIEYLSRPQLNKLQKKISKVRNQVIEEDRQKHEDHCDRLSSVINERIDQSNREEAQLALAVKERTEKIPIENIKFSPSGNLEKVFINGRWLSASAFLVRYFKKELQETEEALKQGKIIRKHARHGAKSHLLKIISRYADTF